MSDGSANPGGPSPPARPENLEREAVGRLEDALTKEPAQLKEEVDVAERAVVRWRDHLIGELRQGHQQVDGRSTRGVLDKVNAALSLIGGVEYPVGGIHRKALEQARDALKAARGRSGD